ncbi:hypothetical protein OH77DRAFT_1433966 [Trametes cingulata]|nr:hypothetical protein OH77DRAFT_1433966 [Trametes cingulata]
MQHGQFSAPTAVQPYHSGELHGYVQSSLFSSDAQASPFKADPWPSSTPSPPTISGSPGGHSAYSDTSATSPSALHPRDAQNHSAYAAYAARTSLSAPYQQASLSSGGYGASYSGAPGYPPSAHQSSTLDYGAHSAHDVRPRPMTLPRCEWGDCHMPIEDSSPSGIARHLKQYHNVPVTDNRTRHPCSWGSRHCGKEMYPSSYGKHIAECHLRNMVKRCPQCGADFARADTLSRHIKAFCRNS